MDDQLKLIDFGLSLIASSRSGAMETLRRTTCGTWLFSAPEAIGQTDENGFHLVSDRSDVWSLGCILYKMVYNKLPFEDYSCRNTHSFFEHMTHKDVVFPSHVGHNDPRVKDVLLLCMKREPTQRPSVQDLLIHPYIKENL